MTLYTLCYPTLSLSDHEFIRKFRRKHDILYRDVVDHHFTIVFGIHDVDRDMYVEHVRRVAASQRPIGFVCRYAMIRGDVESGNFHVFLVPDEGYSDISLLHDRLYTGPLAPFLRLDLPYIPHIAIATIPNSREIKQLCDRLNLRRVTVAGSLDALTICEHDGSRVVDLETCPFKP
jgi:hypothetical protein